jgi:hydrogenase maturation protein HypF
MLPDVKSADPDRAVPASFKGFLAQLTHRIRASELPARFFHRGLDNIHPAVRPFNQRARHGELFGYEGLTMERRSIEVSGIVQGVGFRPFISALASRHALCGFVKNQTGVVLIEVEGESHSLDLFLADIAREPPPLARIEHLAWERRVPLGDDQFRIDPSEPSSASQVFISPDVATCSACLSELVERTDRRHRYPFINCTHCGPRLTIITGAPYDRERTTMASFPMCARCRNEYENRSDRRFHAQPIACPCCGPQLEARDAHGDPIATDNPLAYFAAAVHDGKIGGLKGLGGYHLVCDARSKATVDDLRRRKHRDEKPFAVMVGSARAAEVLCVVSAAERELLQSVRAPIVLLRKRAGAVVADSVAPGNPYLGLMLPYTPVHHLLMEAVGGIPLVMTSGNRSDEPIAYQDDDAFTRLAGIADLFLVHNRPIHVRCDDSVTRVVAGLESPVRRSRGHAPQPVRLPRECPCTILAVGGQLKATFALGRGGHAFLSHHLGDLDHYAAYQAFTRDIGLYEQLFDVRPERVAHDLHLDYASSSYARERARADGIESVGVQHHHAHVASCMAEHRLPGPVIGVAFDGTGFGTDGTIWGGEFLVADYRQFRRAAHLRAVGMPGGDQAIREPWRMAVAHLDDCATECPVLERAMPSESLRMIRSMLAKRINTPMTSSAGRLFDAVAALAGVRHRVEYEGQAAMELEWLASDVDPDGLYRFDLEAVPGRDSLEPTIVIDTRGLIRAVAQESTEGVESARIARRFHSTVVEIISAICVRLHRETGIADVVLSGGVFCNALLAAEAEARLLAEGFIVYRHTLVPPNDGGLSLGQLAIAAAHGQ